MMTFVMFTSSLGVYHSIVLSEVYWVWLIILLLKTFKGTLVWLYLH